MKCPSCGADTDGKFCMYCGTKLKSDIQTDAEAMYRIRELEINREREIEQAKKQEKEEERIRQENEWKKEHKILCIRRLLIWGSILLFIGTWSPLFIVTMIVGIFLKPY